jgi:hypothetical protein
MPSVKVLNSTGLEKDRRGIRSPSVNIRIGLCVRLQSVRFDRACPVGHWSTCFYHFGIDRFVHSCYTFVCYLEEASSVANTAQTVSLDTSTAWGLLESLLALFRAPFLYFQQLADSFRETPEGGVGTLFHGPPSTAHVSQLLSLPHIQNRLLKSFPCHTYKKGRGVPLFVVFSSGHRSWPPRKSSAGPTRDRHPDRAQRRGAFFPRARIGHFPQPMLSSSPSGGNPCQ